MSKPQTSKPLITLLLITLLSLALAPNLAASLQCTIGCLAENQDCEESEMTCALLFEACVEICEHPEDFAGPELTSQQGSIFDPSAGLVFSPAVSHPAAEPQCKLR